MTPVAFSSSPHRVLTRMAFALFLRRARALRTHTLASTAFFSHFHSSFPHPECSFGAPKWQHYTRQTTAAIQKTNVERSTITVLQISSL